MFIDSLSRSGIYPPDPTHPSADMNSCSLADSNLLLLMHCVVFLCNYTISVNSGHKTYPTLLVVWIQIKGNSNSTVLFLQIASTHLQDNQEVSFTVIPI